jgi:hypothetical protein
MGMTHDALHEGVIPTPFFVRRKVLQDKAMQRQTSKNDRDAPGQDTCVPFPGAKVIPLSVCHCNKVTGKR